MVLPSQIETLEDLLNEHLAIARKIYSEDGEVEPMVIGYSGKERILIPLRFNDDDEKEKILRIVTMIFVANNVTRYSVAHEAWVLMDADSVDEFNRLKREGLKIADSPKKSEVLICTACSYDETLMKMHEILPDRSLKEVETLRGPSKGDRGRFAELLPAKNIPKRVVELIKKILGVMTLDFKREAYE